MRNIDIDSNNKLFYLLDVLSTSFNTVVGVIDKDGQKLWQQSIDMQNFNVGRFSYDGAYVILLRHRPSYYYAWDAKTGD